MMCGPARVGARMGKAADDYARDGPPLVSMRDEIKGRERHQPSQE